MGIVSPRWDIWRRFTFETSSPYETILINCLDVPKNPQSVGYLRAVFFTPDLIYSPWLKFFPKPEKEVYTIPLPREIIQTPDAIRRGFEIIKKPKRKPTYQTVTEGEWSVSLEVLSRSGLNLGNDLGSIELDQPIGDPPPSQDPPWDQFLGQ